MTEARHAILIGAMKAGTTSLFSYLTQHPGICPSYKKEPQYFSKVKNQSKALEHYKKLWKCNENHSILLEGSTNYTKHPSFPGVVEAIDRLGIDPLFIYVVRNPIERIISHCNFAIVRRRHCSIFDEHVIITSSYFMQLERYRKYFPKENIHIVDFDELGVQPTQTVSKVFDFLGLPPYEIRDAKVHNKTKKRSIYKLFIKKPMMDGITQEDREKLTEILRPDMEKFSSEYGFNVSKWGF